MGEHGRRSKLVKMYQLDEVYQIPKWSYMNEGIDLTAASGDNSVSGEPLAWAGQPGAALQRRQRLPRPAPRPLDQRQRLRPALPARRRH